MRRSEAFLVEGQRISQTGSWGWKISSGKLVWSDEHYRIFGFDPQKAEPTFQLFRERVHLEDRCLVQQTLDRAIRERAGFALEFRIALPDGSSKHLHGVGRPVLTAAGDIDEYIGITMDITERKRSTKLPEERTRGPRALRYGVFTIWLVERLSRSASGRVVVDADGVL